MTGRGSVLRTAHKNILANVDRLFVFNIFESGGISLAKLFFNLAFRCVFYKWSLNQALFYSSSKHCEFKRFVEDNNIDFVYVDTFRLVPYLVNVEVGWVHVDFDDLFSARYRNVAISGGGVDFGFLESRLDSWIFRLVKRLMNLFSGLILRFEAGRVEQVENQIVDSYNSFSFVSRKELENFATRGRGFWLPMEAQAADVRGASAGLCKNDSLIFLGDFRYSGNLKSLDLIMNSYPEVARSYKIIALGYCPDAVKEKYGKYFDFQGYVANLSEILSGAICMFVPMADSGGVKTKIIDSLSLGLPVITNFNGAFGVDPPKNSILVAETDLEAVRCIELLKDANFRADVIASALMFLRDSYSNEAVSGRWLKLFSIVKE